jgi:chromosome segregation ATPase
VSSRPAGILVWVLLTRVSASHTAQCLQADLASKSEQIKELESQLAASRAEIERHKAGNADKEQVRALTEQLEKADKLRKDHTEALDARIRDLTSALEEAQVRQELPNIARAAAIHAVASMLCFPAC